MQSICLLNTTTSKTVVVELPDDMAADLEHTVLINGFETFNLVSTIPENVKALRNYEQEFEEKEFDTIYDSWFRKPATFNDIAANFEASFNEYFTGCIKEKYPELDKLSDDQKESILITLRTRFMVYMFNKQYENEHKEDKIEEVSCFGEDYAHRIITLFKSLSLDDPTSIQNFSAGLENLEKCMLTDKRRRAGFDALMLGISTAIHDIATVFIGNKENENINLIEAFKNTTTEEKITLKGKLEQVIKTSVDYYEKYLLSIKDAINTIKAVDSNKSIAYLKVASKVISDFVTSTNNYINDVNGLNGKDNATDIIKQKTTEYKNAIMAFSYSFDMLMTAYDSEKLDKTEYGDKLISAWMLYDKEKSSDNDTWYFTLTKEYIAAWNDLFSCLTNKNSN